MANSESLPYILPYSDAVFCSESPFIAHFAKPKNTAMDCSKFPQNLLADDDDQRGTEPHFIDDVRVFRRANRLFGERL